MNRTFNPVTGIKHKPGHLIQLADGRKVVRQNDQPLLKSHGRVVLILLDDEFRIQEKDGKALQLVKTVEEYNELIGREGCKAIGMVD